MVKKKNTREHFSDFLTNFDRNPLTGYLAKAVDQQAVETSMRNLILTNRGEWPMEPYLGSTVRASMFEMNDGRARNEIENAIQEVIKMFEPRVDIHRVVAETGNDPNRVTISVVYSILNIPNEFFEFDVVVNRVR